MKRYVRNVGQSFKKSDRGNVAVMTAVALLVVVGATALSLDISQGVNTKSRLADATDSLSLLLAKGRITEQAEMREVAEEYLAENYPALTGDKIEIISLSWEDDAVTVKLSNVSDNSFGSFLGSNKIDVSVASTAVFSRKPMDIALVLDSTGSMGGSRMTTLKSAGTDMVDLIDEYSNGNVRISVVPFATNVNVGLSQRNASWANVLPDRAYRAATPITSAVSERKWEGCVGSRNAPNHMSVRYSGRKVPAVYKHDNAWCGQPLQPLTTSFSSVKASINSLVASGNTYMPAGLLWGWRTLDDSSPFAHSTPDDTEKALILMTDGQNTVSKNGIHHRGGGSGNADQTTASLCNAIKDDEIIVYTIAYEVSNTATRNLLQGCASEEANYFDARNSAELKKAFEDIANALIEVRISS